MQTTYFQPTQLMRYQAPESPDVYLEATRDEWLRACGFALWQDITRRVLPAIGKTAPSQPIRIACGWPVEGASLSILGQTLHACVSTDGGSEVAISPVLPGGSIDASLRVLDVLAHELLHVALFAHGHDRVFASAAYWCGLQGAPTATTATTSFKERWSPLLDTVGLYPHVALDEAVLAQLIRGKRTVAPAPGEPFCGGSRTGTGGAGKAKDGIRQLKAQCPSCGYTIRLSAKWASVGMPVCPCGSIIELATGAA